MDRLVALSAAAALVAWTAAAPATAQGVQNCGNRLLAVSSGVVPEAGTAGRIVAQHRLTLEYANPPPSQRERGATMRVFIAHPHAPGSAGQPPSLMAPTAGR